MRKLLARLLSLAAGLTLGTALAWQFSAPFSAIADQPTSCSGVCYNISGSAAAPSYTYAASSNDGSFLVSAGTLGFTTAGVQRATLSGTALALSVAENVTSTSATALTVAAAGANYGLQVDESTGSAVTGLKIKSGIAGGGLALSVIGGNAAENVTLDAEGGGTFGINTVASGGITLGRATTVSGLLTANAGATISGAATSINASSNFATNINTGTSTGAFSAGNALAGALTLASGAASTITVTGATLTLSTATSGTLAVTSAGLLNLTGAGASVWANSGAGTFTIQSTAQALTLQTLTSGLLTVSSAGAATVNATAAVLTLQTTTSGAVTVAPASGSNINLTTAGVGNIAFTLGTGMVTGVVAGTGWNLNSQTIAGAGTFSGIITASNITDSTSITTGGLIASGGLGVAKTLYVGTDIYEQGTIHITGAVTTPTGLNAIHIGMNGNIGTLYSVQSGTSYRAFELRPLTFTVYTSAAQLSGLSIDANQVVTMPGNVASVSTVTGTLVVTGGVGISGAAYVGGLLTLSALTANAPVYSGAGGLISASATVSNTLGSDVTLTTAGTYYDGPSVANAAAGTWWACGQVEVTGTASDLIKVKLWDGTNAAVASAQIELATVTGTQASISLCGKVVTPAGNIRLSVTDATTSTTPKIVFNQSGNSADSTLTATRIG